MENNGNAGERGPACGLMRKPDQGDKRQLCAVNVAPRFAIKVLSRVRCLSATARPSERKLLSRV